MRYLKNLSSQSALPCATLPWDWTPANEVPAHVRKDKKARFTWMTNPETDHYFYSLSEGVNPNGRIVAEDSNPVQLIYGIAADYDAPMSESDIESGLARIGSHQPNYIERTMSGFARTVYRFEKPLAIPGNAAYREFLKVASAKLNLKMFSAGYDEGAVLDPARYYTNSGEWCVLDADRRISDLLVRGWWMDASKKVVWDQKDFGPVIPFETLAEKLAEKYPKFKDWPGDFVDNAQGPTFWLEESVSPKSAIAHESGIYTFSQHASKPFYSWADLLGAEFVDEYRVKQQAGSTEGIHYDGKGFWLKNPGDKKRWEQWEKTLLVNHLRVDRHVSVKKEKGTQLAEIDYCLNHIVVHQRVDAAAPYVFCPPGLMTLPSGKRMLNTSNLFVATPVPGQAKWGPDGEFPWLSRYFDALLSTPEQLPFLMSWIAHAYQGALIQKPRQGQVIVLVGPPNIGKTFFSSAILSRLFGGCADAACFVTGNDNFGGDLFESGIWALDDNSYIDSSAAWKRFSEKLKAMAANSNHRYNQKFEKGGMVSWQGRIVVTANCDEESVRQIPATDLSNGQKLSLYRTVEKMPFKYSDFYTMGEILGREIPFFAAYLRDYVIPEHCVGDARYGVAAYHEPSLMEISHQSSPTYAFFEILHDWMTDYIKDHPKETFWEGTAHQLGKAIRVDPTADASMRSYNDIQVGRALASMKNSGRYQIEATRQHGLRLWRITPTKEVVEEVKKTNAPGTKSNSKFAALQGAQVSDKV